MKNIIIPIITVIFVILLISSFVVYAQNEKQEPTLEEKVSEEIDYLNNYLISLLGYFNGLNIQEDTSNKLKEKYTPNWTKIESQTEQLYQTWNTISIDLHALNINGQLILDFSDKLNAFTQNVKKQEKINAMQQLISLYQLLPQYKKSYQPDSYETKMLEIQANIVTAYTAVTNEKWQEAQQQLTKAQQQFSTILNTVSDEKQNQTVMNQCYILVNELISAVSLKDKDIFYIQYQNLVNKMEEF